MMHISSDIAFRRSLCRLLMLLLACGLSLVYGLRSGTGKTGRKTHWLQPLWQSPLSGRRPDRCLSPQQLAKLYAGQFPADAFVPWSKTIYDHKFEIDEQKVRTKHFVYRSHEGYDLEMYIDLPASGSDFPVLFHIFGGG